MLWLRLLTRLLSSATPDLEARMTETVMAAAQDEERAQHVAELKEALRYLCAGAKAIRRKGYTGTASAAYSKQHAHIDRLLDELEATR